MTDKLRIVHNDRCCFGYSEQEKNDLDKLYFENFNNVESNSLVTGTILAISDKYVVVNVNGKSDGIIPLSEFKGHGNIKVGDNIEVYVECKENKKCSMLLSLSKVRIFKSWEKIHDSKKNMTIISAYVTDQIKGGVILDINGVQAFLPGSQIDLMPVHDFTEYIGKNIDVIVIKINRDNNSVIVSHKLVIERQKNELSNLILSQLQKGQVLEGIIKNITSFGAFVNLGGIDGLLYITDISWYRIKHPSEVLTVGQKVNVVVMDYNEEERRISLSMKQLLPNPWDSLTDDIAKVGDKVTCEITNITDYGVFAEIQPGIEGLIHIDEISWEKFDGNLKDKFKIGSKIEALIIEIDKAEYRMALSIKRLKQDPWDVCDVENKLIINSKYEVTISEINDYGFTIEFENGIKGHLDKHDISWTKQISKKSDFESLYKIGDKIEVLVLNVKRDTRKISVGIKQLEQNPWMLYKDEFKLGTNHEVTVLSKNNKDYLVKAEHDLEGYLIKKYIPKDVNIEVGNTISLKVIEFSPLKQILTFAHPKVDNIDFSKLRDNIKTGKIIGNNYITKKKVTLDTILKKKIE